MRARWQGLKNRIATGSLAVLLVSSFGALGATDSLAASNWNRQPSWAAGTAPNSERRRAERDHDLRGPISPFSPGSNNLSLDVGQIFLMGGLGKDYADNIGSQLHYTYGVSEMFAFDASFGYSNHDEGDYSMTSLLTGVRTNLAWYDKVVPYAVFGLGFYRPSERITPTSSVSPILFGVHMGPGVDLELTRNLFFGTSLTFHDMFGTSKMTAEGRKDFGGTYTSFFIRAGVTF